MKIKIKIKTKLSCVVCVGDMNYLLAGRDFLHKISESDFDIYKCATCGLESVIPIPSQREIIKFYPSTYYAYNVKAVKNDSFLIRLREKIVDSAYNKSTPKNFYYYLAKITKHSFSGLPLSASGNNHFLDIGCGDGYNLELMKKYGWGCYGFEISSRKHTQNNIYFAKNLQSVNFGEMKFDYIRIWHVLEHVIDPQQFLEKVARLLAEGGKIEIGIPNTHSLYAGIFGKYWYNRDIPRHVINYNVKNAKQVLGHHDLTVLRIKYQSSGGLLGSLQHVINHKFNRNFHLVSNPVLVLLLYPFDMICNMLRLGDCIALTVKQRS